MMMLRVRFGLAIWISRSGVSSRSSVWTFRGCTLEYVWNLGPVRDEMVCVLREDVGALRFFANERGPVLYEVYVYLYTASMWTVRPLLSTCE